MNFRPLFFAISITSALLAGSLQVQAECSVHDHDCRFHSFNRPALPDGMDDSQDSLILQGQWNGTDPADTTPNANDVDLDVLTPTDQPGGCNRTSSGAPIGFNPFAGHPDYDPDCHVTTHDEKVQFNNDQATAQHSEDQGGTQVVPGGHACTPESGHEYCESVIVTGTPEEGVVTGVMTNFSRSGQAQDIQIDAFATGRGYVIKRSHPGAPHTETLENRRDVSEQYEVLYGLYPFDPHARLVAPLEFPEPLQEQINDLNLPSSQSHDEIIQSLENAGVSLEGTGLNLDQAAAAIQEAQILLSETPQVQQPENLLDVIERRQFESAVSNTQSLDDPHFRDYVEERYQRMLTDSVGNTGIPDNPSIEGVGSNQQQISDEGNQVSLNEGGVSDNEEVVRNTNNNGKISTHSNGAERKKNTPNEDRRMIAEEYWSGQELAHYTVFKGDTLYEIASEFGFSVDEIAEGNGIYDIDNIFPGDSLWMPINNSESQAGNKNGGVLEWDGKKWVPVDESPEMPTVSEYLRLSEWAYGDGKPTHGINNWEIVSDDKLEALGIPADLFHDERYVSGFSASIYFNKKTGAYVVSFRGTTITDMEDIATDIGQISGKYIAYQYVEAKLLALTACNSIPSITFTGHSLGGGLAATAALSCDRPATTFNAAGLHQKTSEVLNLDLDEASKKIIAYSIVGDPVSEGGEALGVEWPPANGLFMKVPNYTTAKVLKCGEYGVCYHGLSNFYDTGY